MLFSVKGVTNVNMKKPPVWKHSTGNFMDIEVQQRARYSFKKFPAFNQFTIALYKTSVNYRGAMSRDET